MLLWILKNDLEENMHLIVEKNIATIQAYYLCYTAETKYKLDDIVTV